MWRRGSPAGRVPPAVRASLLVPSLLPLLAVVLGAGACAREPRCGRDLTPVERPPAFAVVLSDYASSALALLDEHGEVIEPAWVTSGSRAPELVTPVSGDVVLPQLGLGGDRLAWIDRYSVDVLTLVALPGGAVVAQHDLRGDREGARTGFSPNPQDALTLPDGRLLVSRLNPNPDASAPAIALGSDLVALDPETGAMTRIALPCGDAPPDASAAYFARPAELGLIALGDRRVVVAGLARLDASFEHAGPGAVALLDATSLTPLGCVELGALSNCASVAAEPDAPARVIVLCSGPTFAGGSERWTQAGVVELELFDDGSVGEIARVVPEGPRDVPSGGLVATGGGHAVVVSDPRGEDPPRPDRLWDLDLGAGSSTLLAESEPFSLGLGAARGAVLLVPDASRDVLLTLDLEAGRPALAGEIAMAGCAGLPPRQVAPIAP